jgi:diaminohydroxyphosphoribosylaminopyrimidine deaminase / 5-amino-6-(5-phosphoribosylamino)uracil reductase
MNFMTTMADLAYMQRALQLAKLGQGLVSPNPMVGCVVTYNNHIIGEGWHQRYGEAHAEVNAVRAVQDKSLLKEATVYVTLEPCSHTGKTPPCADLLIHHRVKKVVVCNTDTNPLVAGKGIHKLREAGIEVETGLLEQEGRWLNRRFFTFIEKKRPYLILKWAESTDGFIALPNYQAVQISNQYSKTLVHQWRTQEDAIMVGTRTAQYDNPRLDARQWQGRSPLRLVIDKNLSLAPSLHLLDQQQATVVYNADKTETKPNLIYQQLLWKNSSMVIKQIINDLYQRSIQSVIVEGGTTLLQSFIDQSLWDETRVLKSSSILGSGIAKPQLTPHYHTTVSILDDSIFYITKPCSL